MPDLRPDEKGRGRSFSERIGAQERRKLKARQRGTRSIWLGFAVSGLIGWSVVTPMLLGIALGMWLDKHHPRRESWTLSLLIVGIAIGCWNAWRWVAQEAADMRDDQEQKHD